MRDVLIYDIETDSLDTEEAKLKWFGAYSYIDEKYYMLDFTKQEEIQLLLDRHRVYVGFNNKDFDDKIIENNGYKFKEYCIKIDLLEQSASKGTSEYNKYFKNKLKQMGIEIEKFTLKNIINVLKLDKINKGDIDYKIFQKETWDVEEIKEIKKYLKQDILLTKKLFEWYEEQFEPLRELLSAKDRRNYKHITSSLASLAYMIMCNKAGLELKWGEKKKGGKSFSGGHHIENIINKAKGNIVNIDFTSAYPHALIMGNLYSPSEEGWKGNGFFDVKGTYDNKEQGKIEKALKEIFMIRLKAKQEGDKIKSQAYKICINSQYGLTGNPVFETFYNPTTASDCTELVRSWLKKMAKVIETHGFEVLYGFTDNLIIRIPDNLNENFLMDVVNNFIKTIKSNMPFPLDTFKMDVEGRWKFIWFVAKNCYLWVTDKDEVKYKSTLLNKNTPEVIMMVFNEYIKPKIIRDLDVSFSEKELTNELYKILETKPELASEEYKVGESDSYKSKTSIHYQISEVYGEGKHKLIPNKAMVGLGKAKGTKKKNPVRYCTIEQFNNNNLKVSDIDIKKLIQHLKPFITIKEKQTPLFPMENTQ